MCKAFAQHFNTHSRTFNFISAQAGLDAGETGCRKQPGDYFLLSKMGRDLYIAHKKGRRENGTPKCAVSRRAFETASPA